jgi:type VI secretion system protein ImpH
LRTLLADAFAPAAVEVESCVPHWMPIPADQRIRLGEQAHRLGEDCPLGVQFEDCDNLVRIVIADLPPPLFQQLLPGADGHRWLQFLVRFYLTRPLQVAIELRLQSQGGDARLGGAAWSRLGLDTWLPQAEGESASPVSFRLPEQLTTSSRTSSHAAG